MALIPKITNALAKFVSPISQSTAQTKTGADPRTPDPAAPQQSRQHPHPEQKREAPDDPKKRLKLVPSESTDSENEEGTKIATHSQEFLRFQPKTVLRATETPENLAQPHGEHPLAQKKDLPEEQSVTAKLLDIFRGFQNGKKSLNQAAGNQAYKDITKEEQKGKFRRGAMLDEKIE